MVIINISAYIYEVNRFYRPWSSISMKIISYTQIIKVNLKKFYPIENK
jgi:hypothetical protein